MTDRRDLCSPGPQGLSHRPLPDLAQPAEQDRALAYLIDLQDANSLGIERARLLAAIHSTLYELWTAPKGSPLGAPGDDPSDYRGSPWDSDVQTDPPKTSHGRCADCCPPEEPCPIEEAMARMFGSGDPAPYCAYQSTDRA